MMSSRFSPVWVALIAILVVLAAFLLGRRLYRGDGTILRDVTFGDTLITPNADGDTDATRISYEISRNATVSIYFVDEAGDRFYFRRERRRGAGEYQVLFSGVVEGYRLPDETISGEILARLLQNGTYTWVVEAAGDDGPPEQIRGSLTIEAADTILPELRNFTLDKHTFSPNQDGIDDRVEAQYYLTKDATVRVFLLGPNNLEIPIAEKERDVEPGAAGRHYYDYEGGVDNKATPPPDGTYPIVAVAEDAEGQKIRVSDSLTITLGGVPRADIISPASGDTLEFSTTSIVVCDTLYFTMTVENYGTTPIRTTGPAVGTVYDSDWNYNTLGWHTESGAWRVAIGFENEIANYPFRWAIGAAEDLTEIDGFYYLAPGDRTVVTGGIRLTGPLGERNPQPIWGGLIHEDVEISQFNNRVDPKQLLIEFPEPEETVACPPRDIPTRTQ